MKHQAFYFLLTVLFAAHIYSWESHYLLTRQALAGMKGFTDEKTIKAETLDDFVRAERHGLVKLVRDTEELSKRAIMQYAPMPDALYFTGEDKPGMSLTKKFLMSLRVNPDIAFPLFILRGPNETHVDDHSFSAEEINAAPLSTLALIDDGKALKKIMPGQLVSSLEIMTHVDDPDHGLDFYLWKDSNTYYGELYNFGNQPFGNPLLSFGSQAPFHMGFYHESSLLYLVGGFLKRCYPEYRINQFVALSRYAFATGHTYWGYRFLAYALHYVQDLTQPYHSRVAPDLSVVKLIGINLLSLIGFDESKKATTQILSNKHLGLENYQLASIHAALSNRLHSSALLTALADFAHDKNYVAYDENYARQVVGKEAHDRASGVDELVKSILPSRLLDAKFNFDGHDESVNLFTEVNNAIPTKAKELDAAIESLMRNFGAHTRQTIRSVIAP